MKKFIDESWLVLAMGVAFGCLLAGAQTALMPSIQENQTQALNLAIGEVVPGTADAEEHSVELEGDEITIYKCLDETGQLVGWAVDHTGPGFIDKIRVVAGITPALDEIIGIKALEHLETPGLGNKIDSDKGPFAGQFAGKATDTPLKLVKQNPGAADQIQAITGATYSSQYVVDIVNDVIEKIRPKMAALQ